MDPTMLIPTPDPIQVPWIWFKIFMIPTFTIHLILMNLMVGTGLIALFNTFAGAGGETALMRDISKKLPLSMAFTVNMGVPPLLFIQVLYGSFIYTSSILMGTWWIGVVFLLIIAYYSIYIYKYRFHTPFMKRASILMTVFPMLAVGFLFSNNMTLMLTPEKWTAYFENASGTLLNLSEPTLIPRYLHFMTAAVINGGLFIAVIHEMKIRKGDTGAESGRNMGMSWFTRGLAVEIVLGAWFFFALPREIYTQFLGGDPLATTYAAFGIAGALSSLWLGHLKRVWYAVCSASVTLVMMVMMRDALRTLSLEPYFTLSDLPVPNPQYTPMIFFVCALVGGIALIVYMLKLAGLGKEAK